MPDERGKQGQDGQESDGLSKEEWLRQNPGQAFDPEGEEIDPGMSKEDYLRKLGQSSDGGGGAGGQ